MATASLLQAAEDEPPRLLDVKAWRGSIVASVNGLENDDTYASHNAVLVCEVLVDQFDDSEPGVTEWRGKVLSSNLESTYNSLVSPENSSRQEVYFHTDGPLELKPGTQVKLVFHGDRGWSFELTTAQRKGTVFLVMPKTKPAIRKQETAFICGLAKQPTAIPYPAKGLILFGTGEASGVPISLSPLQVMGGVIDEKWEWTAYFEPTSVEELRLEIAEPANYATWRPETTPERGKGPPLDVTATLVSSKGGKPNTRVKSFLWELQGTSAEKGLTMNFPVDQPDTDFDLELEARGENSRLFEKKQKLERTVEGTFTDTVGIVPYDWGGWADLQVTAILVDGRRIRGKLKGKPDTGLRVPQRETGSHIADGWKKSTGASGDDDSDDEKVEGQADNGDGFTLYEEYRGWMEDGKHIEGDPKKKDFFILNLIGADAESGIGLFEGVSQLNVHAKLSRTEMSEEKRLMNGNRRAGAHRVDQHGVWIKTFDSVSALGGSGAFTTLNKTGVGGRPGLVNGIGILARTSEDSDFNKPFNLKASDTIFAYDRAIAHELLHSVGVEHHGEGDYNMIVGYVSTRNPLNKTGRPYYGTELEKPIDLRTEEGEDVAQRDIPDYEKTRQFLDMILLDRCLKEGADYIKRNGASYSQLYDTPEHYADFQIEILGVFCMMHINGVVGVEHGEHSGAEDCLMRYYFAKYYESKKPATIGAKQFYLIDKGTEHTGLQICHDKSGTGVNAPDHKPQSRYGDATNGDCFTAICPNDAVPPRAAK